MGESLQGCLSLWNGGGGGGGVEGGGRSFICVSVLNLFFGRFVCCVFFHLGFNVLSERKFFLLLMLFVVVYFVVEKKCKVHVNFEYIWKRMTCLVLSFDVCSTCSPVCCDCLLLTWTAIWCRRCKCKALLNLMILMFLQLYSFHFFNLMVFLPVW